MADRQIPEHLQARQWRETLGLSRQQLAALSGYSYRSIQQMELGQAASGDPVDPAAWQRYKLICAAITARLDFDWRRVRCAGQTIRADKWAENE